MKIQRALSIRQPFAEMILNGDKNHEERTLPTKIQGRVYIYASKRDRKDIYAKIKVTPGTYPTGVIVGTVEIAGCKKVSDKKYKWLLRNPIRAKRKLRPKGTPQPVWFCPFPTKKA